MQNPFTSITTAGLLLPLDLLTRVGSMDRALPGMTPADYHVPGSIRLNEAATAAYSRALAYWKSFRKKFDALPASDTGTTLTRDEWLLPLFDCLGYGRLQNKRAITIDNKDYPISHGWEDHVPIHLLSARLPLDKRTQNVSGAATRSPYSLVQELLNRSSKHRWGFVSNGLKLYVLRDNASLTRSANVEFDLESMMDGEYHADFTVLFLICHQSRLEIQPTPIVNNKSSNKKAAKPAKAKKSASKVAEKRGKYELDLDDEASEESELDGDEEAIDIEEPTRLGPENCWLEAWTKLAGEQGTRAKERLRDGVQLAIQTFGAGFYTCTSNAVLHERLRSGELSTQDYYRQLLRLVYRLLMLMVAEDKRTESGQNLLHPIDTPAHIRDRYSQFYSVGRIRKLANERRGTPHRDLYESLKTTFLKLRDGYAPLGIPGIGSFLFSDTATPDLDTAQITNEALLDAFRHLCFTDDATGRGGSIRRVVDFGNLGSEELGSIYESLLELHPEIDSQDGPFVLRTAAGNERKTSGSYYTPTSLINCLLDSALDPVVNQAIDVPDREEAKRRLLSLKVCDPACGSGHFLIAASNRMALHLARLETQDTEPTTLQIQHAKRQIIGRCIYGVDINEMAVELCKVSLWMEALEPGKPFSFLENHIKCGNSLLGATPRLLNEGIPDDAFNPIEGDDKAVCSQLKKDNKRERAEHKSGQGYLFEPIYKLGNMVDRFAKLSASDDESLDAITDKQKEYEELIKGAPYLNARFWADTWCAAFVWEKNNTDEGRLCPTERKFREIERSPHSASPMIRSKVQDLAKQYQFFHWHLAFPDVFQLSTISTEMQKSRAGWSRGFDIVLGNPPWEHTELKEKEFFATRETVIANAKTGALRKSLIAELQKENPILFTEFKSALRHAAGISHFPRASGLYTYSARGRINTYALFAELSRSILANQGRMGVIVPTGIATDDSLKQFFGNMTETQTLVSLVGFENEEFLFPGIANVVRFCVLTVSGDRHATPPTFAFYIRNDYQLSEPERYFSLNHDEIRSLSPNTGTCPIFRTQIDANLSASVYKRVPVLMTESPPTNPWGIEFRQGLFNMTSDSGLFVEAFRPEFLPLYEGKFIWHFDHRFASYDLVGTAKGKGGRGLPDQIIKNYQDPAYEVRPRYWVSKFETESQIPQDWKRNWFLAFRDITSAKLERTCVAAIIPRVAVGNNTLLAFPDSSISSSLVACLLANLNSLVFDYFVRQKIGGTHLHFFILKQTPVLRPSDYSSVDITYIASRVVELVCTSNLVLDFGKEAALCTSPFLWCFDRRRQLRAELDAYFARLYGLSREELEFILCPKDSHGDDFPSETFRVLKEKETIEHGQFLTRSLVLRAWDELHRTEYRVSLGCETDTVRDLMLVLEAWQKPASISAIEPALLLMRDDRARAVLSGRENSTSVLSANPKPITLEGIEAIYFALEANKTIEKVGATGYRLAKPELIAQVPALRKALAREAVAIVNSFNSPEEASRAIAAQASFDFQVTN